MCPIKIESDKPFYFSTTNNGWETTQPTTGPLMVDNVIYVLPQRFASLDEAERRKHVVKVKGFPHEPGGMIESDGLNKEGELTLTTIEDEVTNPYFKFNGVTVEGIAYVATNPQDAP